MLEFSETKLRQHAAELGTGDILLAEQDYRLTDILRLIYSNDFLKKRLFLKGGTAINKLFLKDLSRLSVDLDFNVIGKKSDVLADRQKITIELCKLLKEQDNTCKLKTKYTYMLSTIRARFNTIANTQSQIKLEFSFIERFPVLKPIKHKLEIDNKKFSFYGYRIEELLNTKIRALFSRIKGRDLYDLYQLSFKGFDKSAIRKMVIYYLYRSGTIFNPARFFDNLESKFKSEKFVNDINAFIRKGTTFSVGKAIKRIKGSYSFLSEFDRQDQEFIETSKVLLGHKQKEITEYPLRRLFGKMEITDEARNMKLKDIRLFRKPGLRNPASL